ncbi:MAG: hypothetical protein NVS1B10_05850 [Candidatus Saccharimonadales bacterium]
MKWSKADVTRFLKAYSDDDNFEIEWVKGNLLRYSWKAKSGKVWTFEAKLSHGGDNLRWSVHYVSGLEDMVGNANDDSSDLLM